MKNVGVFASVVSTSLALALSLGLAGCSSATTPGTEQDLSLIHI